MIKVRKLSSGWWHVRGRGPCNWSQPPRWPCSEDEIREYAHPEVGERFIAEAAALAAQKESHEAR